MRIAIIQSPEHVVSDIVTAITQAKMQPEVFSLENIAEYAGYVITTHVLNKAVLVALKQQNELGKPILGVGDGAVWLAEIGWVPGVEDDKPVVRLTTTMTATDIILTQRYQYNAFTRCLAPNTAFTLSINPKYQFAIPPALLLEMEENGLIVFRYNHDGIAVISNKMGNIMTMLAVPAQWDLFFQSMYDYILKGYRQKVLPLYYYPRS